MSALSPPRARFVPEDGPDNPVFLDVDPRDAIQTTFLFSPALSDDDLDVVESVVMAWFAGAEWGGAKPELLDETLTPSALHVAVAGVPSARSALSTLVVALERAHVGLSRAVFTRVPADGDRDVLVRAMSHAAGGQVRYDDACAWWRACFDPSAVPPLSEDSEALARDANALIEIAATTFAERRGLPLHVPGVRVCWGLGEITFAESDPRTREVARVLGAGLRERFDALVPTPYDRQTRGDGSIDRIVVCGRVGYSFAFRAEELREFLHGHAFRYREYELMLAARDAVSALGLEPVVCWRRFDGRYVMQLWERAHSHVDVAA